MIYKGPKKLLILDIELRLMKDPVVPIGNWLFCTCYILEFTFTFTFAILRYSGSQGIFPGKRSKSFWFKKT